MYKYDDVGSTFLSLPPNLQTTENECFGYAFDRQMQKMNRLAHQLSVWGDLDNTDPKYYDYMAMTIGAPYYKSEYTDAQKLGIIKSAPMKRRYAGTIKAIEELLKNTISSASFMPWYEYGGEPYHFKVKTGEVPDADLKTVFNAMLKRVKAARTIFDFIEILIDPVEMHITENMSVDKMEMSFTMATEDADVRIRDEYAIEAGEKENAEAALLMYEDYWCLDGSELLDGSRILDADVKKEEL
jgi:P2-related tail formation protein